MGFGVDVAIRTVWGEARGEGPDGMAAVGHVLLNRLNSGRWGPTLGSVCWWPYQFSCWNYGDPNRLKILNMPDTAAELVGPTAAFLKAQSDNALNPKTDPTNGATHYYAINISPPAWTKGATKTLVLGRQVFYSNVP